LIKEGSSKTKTAKVSKTTVSKACNEKEYIPRQDAMKKILKAIRKVVPL
jgi:DNA-binding LacI/PurR family transcriptional regulator